MKTHKINISFIVNVDGDVALRDLEIDWILSDSAKDIAEDVREAILNIE